MRTNRRGSPGSKLLQTLAVCFGLDVHLALSCIANEEDAASNSFEWSEANWAADIEFEKPHESKWSVQVTVAMLTTSDVGEVLVGDIDRATGDAGGQIYSIAVNWTAHRFEIPAGRHVLTPRFEPYARLTLVDEEAQPIFPDYNAGVGFRWVNFPWNRWVRTTLFMGVGLSYSARVYTVDREQHPGEERSHLKFDWPIELS